MKHRAGDAATVETLVRTLKEIGREDAIDGLLHEIPAFKVQRLVSTMISSSTSLKTRSGRRGSGQKDCNQSRDSGISGENGGGSNSRFVAVSVCLFV